MHARVHDAAASGGLLQHPLLCCGFRPFFLLTALAGLLLPPLWIALLYGLLPLPMLPGGPVAWHAHEMIFGFAYASVVGFLLTAVPEFTGAPAAPPRLTLQLALLWLSARVAYLLSPLVGLWPALLLNGALALRLLAFVAGPLARASGRAHASIGVVLALLACAQAAFFVATLTGADAMRWLHVALGLLMVLIVLAQSRISMRVVNGAVERPDADAGYRPRPPRRNLAVACIGLHTALSGWQPEHAAAPWLAAAAAAAMLNVLNDWHIGRALFTRWALLLYAVYALMALGYALLAAAGLGAALTPSAGRHVLAAGAMSLAILVVMCIAGRAHSGRPLDTRAWVPLTAAAGVAAAAAKAVAMHASAGAWSMSLHVAAALLFAAAFGTYLVFSARALIGPRPRGKHGCDEPDPPQVPLRFVPRPVRLTSP